MMEVKIARSWAGDSLVWDRSRVCRTVAGLERAPAHTADRLFQLQRNILTIIVIWSDMWSQVV